MLEDGESLKCTKKWSRRLQISNVDGILKKHVKFELMEVEGHEFVGGEGEQRRREESGSEFLGCVNGWGSSKSEEHPNERQKMDTSL